MSTVWGLKRKYKHILHMYCLDFVTVLKYSPGWLGNTIGIIRVTVDRASLVVGLLDESSCSKAKWCERSETPFRHTGHRVKETAVLGVTIWIWCSINKCSTSRGSSACAWPHWGQVNRSVELSGLDRLGVSAPSTSF